MLFITSILFTATASAATIDGNITIGAGEYNWSTDGNEGSSKWISQGNYANDPDSDDYANGLNQEYDDGSTGDRWDINYLGTDVKDGKFQFGTAGGAILSGTDGYTNDSHDVFLSDFAISVANNPSNPTLDSSDWNYAIRLLSVDNNSGEAEFALLEGGTWIGADLYGKTSHQTDTYQMTNSTTLALFSGKWSNNGGDDNVLEGEFDLSLLSLFDANSGGVISTYLTMTCVNDEALVTAEVSAVPIPAALWLFGPALLGLLGLRRKEI